MNKFGPGDGAGGGVDHSPGCGERSFCRPQGCVAPLTLHLTTSGPNSRLYLLPFAWPPPRLPVPATTSFSMT